MNLVYQLWVCPTPGELINSRKVTLKIEEKCANSDPAQVWNGPARPGCHFWRRSFLPRKFPAALVFAEKKAKFGTRVLLLFIIIIDRN